MHRQLARAFSRILVLRQRVAEQRAHQALVEHLRILQRL